MRGCARELTHPGVVIFCNKFKGTLRVNKINLWNQKTLLVKELIFLFIYLQLLATGSLNLSASISCLIGVFIDIINHRWS